MEEKNKKTGKEKSKAQVIKKKLNKYKVDPKKGKNNPKNKKKSGPAKKPSPRVNKNVGVSAKNPISIDQPRVPGGYVMNMGSKQKDDPNNFSQKDQGIIKQLPAPPKTVGGLGLVEYFGPSVAAKLPKIFKYITGYKDYAKVTSKAIPKNKPYVVGGKKYGYITKDGKLTSSKYENMTKYSPKNRKPTFKSPKIIEKAKAFALSKKNK